MTALKCYFSNTYSNLSADYRQAIRVGCEKKTVK